MQDVLETLIVFGFLYAVMHLVIRGRQARRGVPMTNADGAALEQARAHARRLEERVASLERVLDEDGPSWRRGGAS